MGDSPLGKETMGHDGERIGNDRERRGTPRNVPSRPTPALAPAGTLMALPSVPDVCLRAT